VLVYLCQRTPWSFSKIEFLPKCRHKIIREFRGYICTALHSPCFYIKREVDGGRKYTKQKTQTEGETYILNKPYSAGVYQINLEIKTLPPPPPHTHPQRKGGDKKDGRERLWQI